MEGGSMERRRHFARPLRGGAARLLAGLALWTAALCLSSCTVVVRDVEPPVVLPAKFGATGGAAVPDKWWTSLGDGALNALVDRALASNLDLWSVWDRLAQAEAVARKAGAELYPALSATGGGSRTRSVNTVEVTVPIAPAAGAVGAIPQMATRTEKVTSYENQFSLGLGASYEVDLWGRIRASRNAARLEARATREDLAAAAMSLAAEVAATWYRLVDQRGQIRLLDEQVQTNQRYLESMTLRVRARKVLATDVLQQRQLLESTRAEKHLAESSREVLEHQLAILLGQGPRVRAWEADGTLPKLPPVPGTGLPAALVRRRPDVRSGYLRLQAANQGVAAAVADRFPRLSLSARAEAAGAETRDLFENWLSSLASNLTAPLFEGGRKVAEVDRARAAASERLHAYGEKILNALKEVEDALVQERQQRDYLASLDRQLALSAAVAEQTQRRYLTTGTDYLRALTALQSHQRHQRSRLQAERQLVEFRISLYRALGGGWEMHRPAALAAARAEERKAK